MNNKKIVFVFGTDYCDAYNGQSNILALALAVMDERSSGDIFEYDPEIHEPFDLASEYGGWMQYDNLLDHDVEFLRGFQNGLIPKVFSIANVLVNGVLEFDENTGTNPLFRTREEAEFDIQETVKDLNEGDIDSEYSTNDFQVIELKFSEDLNMLIPTEPIPSEDIDPIAVSLCDTSRFNFWTA
jgi:hypothetical protein